MKKLATQIVDAILKDLRSRKGVGDELDSIERDIYAEMKSELIEIVTKILTP